LINLVLFLTVCFASNPVDNWFEQNREVLSSNIKSASIHYEAKSQFYDQLNNTSSSIKIIFAENKKFRIAFENRIIVSDGTTWKVYNILSNQLFIQNPDKKLEKLLFVWFKLKKIKTFSAKKINDKEYEISFFETSNKARLFFNNIDDLQHVLIINDDLEIKISNIELKKENSIDLTVGNKNTEIFDLR
tara:strand:+ start:170 stop:736 length:567 start_codon:yes stop_codon:yes gene_type:complete